MYEIFSKKTIFTLQSYSVSIFPSEFQWNDKDNSYMSAVIDRILNDFQNHCFLVIRNHFDEASCYSFKLEGMQR